VHLDPREQLLSHPRITVAVGKSQRNSPDGGRTEIRNSKHETRNKFKIRNSNAQNKLGFEFVVSVILICFGFRVSDFGFDDERVQKMGKQQDMEQLSLACEEVSI
jgi:hypothetical protein